MEHKTSGPATAKIVIAFTAIYLIWGTTYLAMRIAVETIPPFTVGASRFLVAGGLTLLFLRMRGVQNPTLKQWKNSAFIGCLLVVGGNGLVMWAVQRIPSGIAALVVATMPLWMTLFDWLFYKGPRPTVRVVIGLGLGFVGIVFLMRPDQVLAGHNELHLPSMIALFLAPIFWSIGSLHSRLVELPKNIFMTTALESLGGGFVLMLLCIGMNEPSRLDITGISTQSILATLYLAVFGSLLALTAYSWLLKNVSVARVSTYTFINPVIAVVLGWLILSEELIWQTTVAVLLIVFAVVLIVTKKQPRSQPVKDEQPNQDELSNEPTIREEKLVEVGT